MPFPDNPPDGTVYVTPTGAAYRYVASEQYWLPDGLGSPQVITFNSRRVFPQGKTGVYGTLKRGRSKAFWRRGAGSRIDILHKTSGAGETFQTFTNTNPGDVNQNNDEMVITGIYARAYSSPNRYGRIVVRNPNTYMIDVVFTVFFETTGMPHPIFYPNNNATIMSLNPGETLEYIATTNPVELATTDAHNEWPVTIEWRRLNIYEQAVGPFPSYTYG